MPCRGADTPRLAWSRVRISKRDRGTARKISAQVAMTCGVTLAKLLNDPNVMNPLVAIGGGTTGGAFSVTR